MKKLSILCFILMLLSLSACSSKLMTPVSEQQNLARGNEATITFFRTSVLGGMIQAPIAVETPAGLELVGIASTDTRIRYNIAPGRYVFVVGGESGSVLDANVSPGLKYYVRVDPGFGFGKTRFELVALRPEELSDPSMQAKIRKCTLVGKNRSAEQWFLEHKASMEAKLARGKEKYQERDDATDYVMPASCGITELY